VTKLKDKVVSEDYATVFVIQHAMQTSLVTAQMYHSHSIIHPVSITYLCECV